MEIVNFSEHVFLETLDDSLIDPLIANLYDLREKEPESDGRSNANGWQKNGLQHFSITDDIKSEIHRFVDNTVRWTYHEYTSDEDRKDQDLHWVISMENIFANINGKGSYHVMHQHGGSNFSGVIYLQTPEKCGDIYLQCPFRSPWMNLLPIPAIQDTYRQLCPQRGLMILFPSYILHHVDENRSDEDRIAVSFNVNVCYSSDIYQSLEKSR